MRRVCGGVLVLAIVGFLTGADSSPPPPPLLGVAGRVLTFLDNAQLREELKLSQDQVKKIDELRGERRQAFDALRGLKLNERAKKRQELAKTTGAALAKILTPKQLRRAEQIVLQRRGPMLAFAMPQVAEALELTDKQKEKIKRIRGEMYGQFRDRLRQGQVTRQQSAEMAKRGNEKLFKVLTPAQKTKWKQMTGEPFKFDSRRVEKQNHPGQGSLPPLSN